jgi:hypothetical protein
MSFSLFPKTVRFFKLFSRQNDMLREAVSMLNNVFQDFTDVENKCKYINIIESDANAVCRDIAKQLSRTFITPIDREDIHEINLGQEDMVNLIRAISTRIALYDFGNMRFAAKKLVGNLKIMVDETGVMLQKLRSRKEVDIHVARVKTLKAECDMLLVVALAENYDAPIEEHGAILDIVKWSHIYDRIEKAIHRTENLVDIIEGIVLKNA